MLDTVRPLDVCLHPVAIHSNDGSIIFVPCGKCQGCKHSHRSSWRNRLDTHASCGKFTTLFITLTYSNEHLPLVHYDPDTSLISDVTCTKFNKRGVPDRVSCLSLFLERDPLFPFSLSNLKPLDFPHWVSSRNSNSICYDHSNTFAICLRKDVQDFVKRLRTLLSRTPDLFGLDTSFSYFICSEYGPKTFRPHYHGLLFFNNQTVAEFCNNSGVLKAWSKSDFSSFSSEASKCSQIVSNPQGCSKYVSKYVTCTSSLPTALNLPLTSSFYLASKSVPIGSVPFDFSTACDKIAKGDILSHSSYIDPLSKEVSEVSIPFPNSCWRRFFPRFCFDGLLSNECKIAVFRRLFSFRHTPNKFIPNYINEVVDKYNIGSVSSFSPVLSPNLGFISPQCFRHWYPENPDLIWRSLGCFRSSDYFPKFFVNASASRITYSSVFSDFVNDSNFLDYYLFGIPQNRCASLKILKLLASDGRHLTFDDYWSLYNRFYCLVFRDSLKRSFEYEDFCLSVTPPCPALVKELYPSFYASLPEELEVMSIDEFCIKNTILNYRFNLDLCEFYDSDFKLLDIDDDVYGFRAEYQKFVSVSDRKHESSRLYKHDVNLCK